MNFLLFLRTISEKWNNWVNLNMPPSCFPENSTRLTYSRGASRCILTSTESPVFNSLQSSPLYNLKSRLFQFTCFGTTLVKLYVVFKTFDFFFNCWNSILLVLKLRIWHFYTFYCKASLKAIIFKTCKNRSYLITTLSIMLSSPAVVSFFTESHVLKETKFKSEERFTWNISFQWNRSASKLLCAQHKRLAHHLLKAVSKH